MRIGILREIKAGEQRVALVPRDVAHLVRAGHEVRVEQGAGTRAGHIDVAYRRAGARIGRDPVQIAAWAGLVLKVKEPLEAEWPVLDALAGRMLFTFLHLSGSPAALTDRLLQHRITAIAYENVVGPDGGLPILRPMSEAAGVLAVQHGAQFLQRRYGGRGFGLGAIHGAPSAHVTVIGGGTVGTTAAALAVRMGADVVVHELDPARRRALAGELPDGPGRSAARPSTAAQLAERLPRTDLLIGAVLVPGAHAPRVVSRQQLGLLPDGAVVVDVAIDQGGCIAGLRPTSHDEPIRRVGKILTSAIPNMPAALAPQVTAALSHAVLPHARRLADGGVAALRRHAGLRAGLMTHAGRLTNDRVAHDLARVHHYRPATETLV